VDRFGKDEVIFLGPDEQVIPADIDWIIQRAAVRGYGLPAAFMSSKKVAGFNHKEFGVTSEGVVVYLDVALRESLNIDPHKQSFTLKITGGPDGDVAGNLIKILFREYGTNPKIVGISDGEGVAEDPNGLDPTELLRLVEHSLTIDHFDKSKLGPNGLVMNARDSDEALLRRNSMPFRLKADAFVPAGGRPNTINATNWRNFLDENGEPTSKLIVEGANIYNTKEARESLFKEAGVIIVKDSSANKCGVVTSSCEIAGSMLLSKEEFIANKPELIRDVLAHLRHIAEAEAKLLFSTYKNFPGALPHFSERISGAINSLKDAIIKELEGRELGDPLLEELLPLVKYVPPLPALPEPF
jgi:glutamate dehydrogenase